MDLFTEAMNLTLGNEGGWYDGSDPRDPNPTMWGVTQNTYDAYRKSITPAMPLQSVRQIKLHERDAIYRRYWDGTCDKLPRLAALTAFDMSINAGPLATRKLIQAALGVESDGVFGPKTLAAIEEASLHGPVQFAKSLLLERVVFYRILAKNAVLRPNLHSWIARVADFYTDYVRGA
jgi:lysozyme family protein